MQPHRARSASADPPLMNATTGIPGCCARAASGHAAAAPPSAAMNSRLPMPIAIRLVPNRDHARCNGSKNITPQSAGLRPASRWSDGEKAGRFCCGCVRQKVARNRSAATSAIWSRSGGKRTQLGHRQSVAFGPVGDIRRPLFLRREVAMC